MHSLPDGDNIKSALWRWESCHTSLGERKYRKAPLLRPFITKLATTCGALRQNASGGGSQRKEQHKGRWRTPTSHHTHTHTELCQRPGHIWGTGWLLINRFKIQTRVAEYTHYWWGIFGKLWKYLLFPCPFLHCFWNNVWKQWCMMHTSKTKMWVI